jgi:hypothetical protein
METSEHDVLTRRWRWVTLGCAAAGIVGAAVLAASGNIVPAVGGVIVSIALVLVSSGRDP